MTSVCPHCQTPAPVGARDCEECFAELTSSPPDPVATAVAQRFGPQARSWASDGPGLDLREVKAPASTTRFSLKRFPLVLGLAVMITLIVVAFPRSQSPSYQTEAQVMMDDAAKFIRAGAFLKAADLAAKAEQEFRRLDETKKANQALLLQADALRQATHWEAALAIYQQLPDKDSAREECQRGLAKQRRQEAMKALKLGRQSLPDDPEDALAWGELAYDLFRTSEGAQWQVTAAQRLIRESRQAQAGPEPVVTARRPVRVKTRKYRAPSLGGPEYPTYQPKSEEEESPTLSPPVARPVRIRAPRSTVSVAPQPPLREQRPVYRHQRPWDKQPTFERPNRFSQPAP